VLFYFIFFSSSKKKTMKYFVLLAAICACAFAAGNNTYKPIPPPYCAYSIAGLKTVEANGTSSNNVNFYVASKDGNLETSLLAYYDKNEVYICRGDKSDVAAGKFALVHGDSSASTSCEAFEVDKAAFYENVNLYIGALYNEFEFDQEDEDNCGDKKCRRLCKEDESQCLWVLKDCDKNCVYKYGVDLGEYNVIYSYITYKELSDMSFFKLDKTTFPGCADTSYAYTAPDSPCVTPSPSSHKSSAAPSPSPKSGSARISVSILMVVAAVLAMLF